MNEWEFTADVASWINEILAKDKSLPFSRAKCEQRGPETAKRRDITLLDDRKIVVLTGEVKLPYQKDGGSPYNERVVQDARKKAEKAKSNFFFTWNVNELVLWETFPKKTAQVDRKFKAWTVTEPAVHKPGHLESPSTTHAIQSWLTIFLNEFADILKGKAKIGTQLPDEKFIVSLESSLKMPILMTTEELHLRYNKQKFKTDMDKWMREEQGWIIYDDAEGIRENLERSAQFACYALVNKFVFHEALLKRYGAKMDKISVPEYIDTAEDLRLHFEGYFAIAKKVTRDYETVFGENHTSIGNRIPFFSDSAVPHWRALVEQIHDFDFSKIDYEVIGNIFERLISPDERHKYGQFYTRPEVVDLINSFCIRTGKENVMDPACGGGTFLVRAYARKREIAPDRKHGEILTDLYGVDISHFATHLTTINLATRDLIDDENYPQIARSDFFEVKKHHTFVTLPSKIKTKGLGALQHREIEIPPLDAIVGNPPYIRQEDIPRATKKNAKGEPQHGTKDYYQWLTNRETGIELSGRSDIHCYFWPHSTTFLKEDGYLCLLTSSQWMDVEYGFRLQEWMLHNFEIVAIFESIDEPWFEGARVVTAATILRRQHDEGRRMDNRIRFVQLHQPIGDILAHDGTTPGAVEAADRFRDEILSASKNTITGKYRLRLLDQRDLYDEGLRLAAIMDEPGRYYGGKWGMHLHAPDLWFSLIDRYGSHFKRLTELTNMHRGITTGNDKFFLPRDASAECLKQFPEPEEFKNTYGLPRKEVESGRVKMVHCGEGRGEIRPIESKYLEPEVHSLMEVSGYTVSPEECSRLILLVNKRKDDIKGTYVLEYIKWGEKKDFHKGSTCEARASESRSWYDITGHDRGKLFWPKSQQYKHVVPINDHNLQCNCNLYDFTPIDGIDPMVMAGILNSSIVVLSKFQFGRPVGVEGNLKTEVIDVKMMLVPDPTQATKESLKRVKKAFERLKQRHALQFLSERRMREMAYRLGGKEDELADLSDQSELDMADRRELDDAVLELIGIDSKKQRTSLLDELYTYLHYFFEMTRRKEEKAIANKKKSKRREKTNPSEIAVQIYKEIADDYGYLLSLYNEFLDPKEAFDTFDVPTHGLPERITNDMFSAHGVRFKKGKKEIAFVATKNESQDELLIFLVKSGVRGITRIPRDSAEVRRVLNRYERFCYEREDRVKELIEQRTSDPDIQERIYAALLPMILHRQ